MESKGGQLDAGDAAINIPISIRTRFSVIAPTVISMIAQP
jgi:hypothetical protein